MELKRSNGDGKPHQSNQRIFHFAPFSYLLNKKAMRWITARSSSPLWLCGRGEIGKRT